MLVRGAVAREVDVALPDRADRGAAATSTSAPARTAVAAEGEDGHLRAPARPRRATATETVLDVDACFVFIGAAPRTDWLDGVVARDERGFILAGRRRAGRGLAAEARPVPARDERARRVRRRRRARALDQARRERGRRGLDGRLAHPPVPRRRMTARVDRRRPARRRPLRRPRRRAARPSGRRSPSRTTLAAGRAASPSRASSPTRRAAAARGRRRRRCSSTATAPSRSAASAPPTWMGAIAVLTGGALGVRMQRRDRRAALARDRRPTTSAGSRFAQPAGAPPRHAARSRR